LPLFAPVQKISFRRWGRQFLTQGNRDNRDDGRLKTLLPLFAPVQKKSAFGDGGVNF
jgi:hypothetical protein